MPGSALRDSGIDKNNRRMQMISALAQQHEVGHDSHDVVSLSLNSRDSDERESQIEGQAMLWLIAFIYLALVFGFYFGAYVALNVFSLRGGVEL